MALEQRLHNYMIAIAKAMFADRLHVLRLTEIVRYNVRPNDEGLMILPPDVDEEMKKQAFDFVVTMMPSELQMDLHQLRSSWLTVQ